jgi:hypothetical protein
MVGRQMPMEYGSWAIPLLNQQYRMSRHSFMFIAICQIGTRSGGGLVSNQLLKFPS